MYIFTNTMGGQIGRVAGGGVPGGIPSWERDLGDFHRGLSVTVKN